MQLVLFLLGAILGRFSTRLFRSVPLAVGLTVLPALSLAIILLDCLGLAISVVCLILLLVSAPLAFQYTFNVYRSRPDRLISKITVGVAALELVAVTLLFSPIFAINLGLL